MILRSRPTTRISLFVFLTFGLLTGSLLDAQSERDRSRQIEQSTRDEVELRNLEPTLGEDDEFLQDIDFDYGGWFRYGFYRTRDNLQTRRFKMWDFRLWSNFVYQNTHQLYMRVMGININYHRRNEYYYMENNDHNAPRLDIGYYYGDLNRALGLGLGSDTKLRLQLGRNYETLGEGMVMDDRGDGAKIELGNDKFEFTGLVMRSIYSTDMYDRSYIDFGSSRYLSASGEVVGKFSDTFEVFGYTLFRRFKNDASPLNLTQRFGYDPQYHGGGMRGQFGPSFVYFGEAAWQLGSRYSDGSVERDRIEAFAFTLGSDYTFVDAETKPKISAQYMFGSGDAGNGGTTVDTLMGNRAGTNDNTFFTIGYIDMGYCFYPLLSNIETYKIGFALEPWSEDEIMGDVEIGVNQYFYRKHRSRGGISDRAILPGYSASRLGHETDFYCNWRPVSDISLMAQAGIFFPSTHAFSDDDHRSFFSWSAVVYF